MASISIPYSEPWVVARWAFHRLIDRTAELVGSDVDRGILDQAKALDGIHFDLLEKDEAARIARSMEVATRDLRAELLKADGEDPRDAGFAEALAVLGLLLHDVFE